MSEMIKLNDQNLGSVAGGIGESGDPGWRWVRANVRTGYLALRSAPAYDYRNEIAKIVNGTAFQIKPGQTSGKYVYACLNGLEGWVNSGYITGFEAKNN